MKLSDQEILQLFKNPNSKEKGFSALVKTHQEQLYWTIRRIVHIHSDTDDILQNTFIKAYRYLADFNQKSSLRTWLYRIATNESLSHLRRESKRRTGSLDQMMEEFGEKLKADEYFDGDDYQIELKKAIETLPEKQRIVFTLRYYDEMPYKEMAEILETSDGALKASYHHAVKKIEAYIKNE